MGHICPIFARRKSFVRVGTFSNGTDLDGSVSNPIIRHQMQTFFDYKLVDNISLITCYLDADFSGHPVVVNCLNPHSFVNALDDSAFHMALKNSDYLLPDGEGICLALKKYRGISIKKIAGDDLHSQLLSSLSNKGGKAYYMGSSEKVLSLIKNRLANEHHSVETRTWPPSFCDELSDEESHRIIDDINTFSPDILFVSMTAPKQEKWVEKYRGLLTNVKIIASIGAVFDFYAGTVKRAPSWAVKMRIEWLFRLLKEPRRMWNRNFVSTPRFLRYVKHNSSQI